MAPPRQLPALTDDLLEEIFIRISCPTALTRASAASVAFRRLITDPTFLRRYRTRHPPLLLGFLNSVVSNGFHPVEAPHPGAPAARAIANSSVVDYLPQDKIKYWYIRDVREGRVLIECSDADDPVLPDFAVCDPLSQRYLMLPRLQLCKDKEEHDLEDIDVLFAPCAEENDDETSFRVIGAMHYVRKLVVLEFYSGSVSWTVITCASWDDLILSNGIELCRLLDRPYYAYGGFYWKVNKMNKLLKLDITRRELSTVDLPPNHYNVQWRADLGCLVALLTTKS